MKNGVKEWSNKLKFLEGSCTLHKNAACSTAAQLPASGDTTSHSLGKSSFWIILTPLSRVGFLEIGSSKIRGCSFFG